MAHKVPDLYLHVGLQKTGTTTIQGGLTRIRKQLHARRVAYIDRRDMIRLPSIRDAASRPRRDLEGNARFRQELADLVDDYLQRAGSTSGGPARALLISNEELVGVIRKSATLEDDFRPRAEQAIAEVISVVQPERTHLLLYTRRQDTMLESLYMHQVHAAQSFEFQEYLRAEQSAPKMYLHQLATRLAQIEGVSSLRVRPYEIITAGATAFIRDLLAPLDLVDLDWSALEGLPRKNESYSAEALRIALKANPYIRSRRERLIFKRVLSRAFPIKDHGRAPLLDGEARAQLIEHYRADNERLFAEFMPELPADSYSSTGTMDRLRGVLG